MKIAPSILSADFGKLRSEIEEVADLSYAIHFDVMDGHFVPNITIGPLVVNSLHRGFNLPFHIHLMIENPHLFADRFKVKSGDSITFHIETVKDSCTVIEKIRKGGAKVGVTLNPETPLEKITDLLPTVDMILVMSVSPGFGGQELMPGALARVRKLKEVIERNNLSTLIEVDGGINKSNVKMVLEAGADIIVAGSAIFGEKNRRKAIQQLQKAAES